MTDKLVRFTLIVITYSIYALAVWAIWNLVFPIKAEYLQCLAACAILDLLREMLELARQIQEAYCDIKSVTNNQKEEQT